MSKFTGFNNKLAEQITKHIGTMFAAYVFAVIGIGSLIGVVTGNTILALLCGAVSSYFLQLVLLPIIMVSQNQQTKKSDARMTKMLEHISNDNDRILEDLKSNG